MERSNKPPEWSDVREQREIFQQIAAKVPNNHVLMAVLKNFPVGRRREAYEILRPLLNFQPKPWLLFKF